MMSSVALYTGAQGGPTMVSPKHTRHTSQDLISRRIFTPTGSSGMRHTLVPTSTMSRKKVLDHSIKQSFWQLGGWSFNPHWTNPWKYGHLNAPFDQEFYLIINLACGGLTGFFPDGPR